MSVESDYAREALFAQPDAGAMAEAREIVREWYHGPIKDAVGKLESRLVAAIATALTRREAAGFARGVEAAIALCDERIKEYDTVIERGKGEHCTPSYVRDDVWNGWHGHRSEAIEIKRRLASASRALLGAGKE
jgi:hypothetical protein